MAGQMTAALAALLLLCHSAVADHPCTTEVASACADRPGSDIGACLKDPEEHDYPTEISSGCTDFIALNKACAEDLETHCDGGHFGDDTILCLTKWTQAENLQEQCQKVLSWAVPTEEAAAGDDEVVTDELGMSDKDYEEKKEWQRKRKEARGESIERMKMKDVDKKKEEDRVSLEEYKRADPEGFASMIQQQEEEARQQANFKKQERARAAAIERAKKKAAGGDEEEEEAQKSQSKSGGAKKSKGSWTYSIISFAVIGGLGFLVYSFVTSQNASGANGGSKKQGGGKKKRG